MASRIKATPILYNKEAESFKKEADYNLNKCANKKDARKALSLFMVCVKSWGIRI